MLCLVYPFCGVINGCSMVQEKGRPPSAINAFFTSRLFADGIATQKRGEPKFLFPLNAGPGDVIQDLNKIPLVVELRAAVAGRIFSPADDTGMRKLSSECL